HLLFFIVRIRKMSTPNLLATEPYDTEKSNLCGREKKCIAGFQPAKVVLTQKELSRLRCRRDAGATIFSHDLCLRGEHDVLPPQGHCLNRSLMFIGVLQKNEK